ncbi:MAG: hypothetical protein HY904_20330 [Deltaproteobacteria bacterium]|nr:hypothetical protein [Deltaproteobacteria bacterium]
MITALTLALCLVGNAPPPAEAHRWKVQAARLPVERWASAVGGGGVVVAALPAADEDRALAGLVKRAVAGALSARNVRVVTVSTSGVSAPAALERARTEACSHVLVAAVNGREAPAVGFTLQTAAGETVAQETLPDVLGEAPLLAVVPVLSEQKIKRDAATLAFPRHAVRTSFIVTTRDNIPISHELQLWDRATGRNGYKRTGEMCRVAQLPPEAVDKVCTKDAKASETWDADEKKMPERAVQLLILADAYNVRIAHLLGAETIEFGEEYFPAREIQAWQEKNEREKRKKNKKQADEEEDE